MIEIANNNKKTGNKGENIAKTYLESNNYIVLDTNYNTIYGEIDIIAQKDDCIIFVEVKSRNSNNFGKAMEAVDEKKIDKIYNTSLQYIVDNSIANKQFRYDVIEVYIKDLNINHIVNAFYII